MGPGDILRWIVRPVAGSPAAIRLLMLMVCLDFLLLVLHGSRGLLGYPESWRFSLTHDWSIGEIVQYLKYVVMLVALTSLWRDSREFMYAVWMAIVAYLLLDDGLTIHETVGDLIAGSLAYPAALGLRPRDFGELTVLALVAVIIVGLLVWTYLRSATSARHFCLRLVGAMVLLAFFAAGVDMVHAMTPVAADYVGTLEDFGEMISVSGMTALVMAYWHGWTAGEVRDRREGVAKPS